MKIAMPVHDGNVDTHFGHAEQYYVFTISPENKIQNTELIHPDQGCGCKSGIASILADKGVTILLAGNIGAGAIQHMYAQGVEVIRGCEGEAVSVVQAFLGGQVEDNKQTCRQHEGCDHHPEHF
ncbi:MAG TPA: NifB/NifX family molybdenum-iron cluster-binding protein [Bacteroidales bacterium]|nr:NifB/NifX family molybdenum-iron cluster-binding protein [Bacteroidales bacterium]